MGTVMTQSQMFFIQHSQLMISYLIDYALFSKIADELSQCFLAQWGLITVL